jgi:hypothetical protein
MSASQRPLTVEQILTWMDAHAARTGRRPHAGSGAIPGAPGETWRGIQKALKQGLRGLPGGDSLSFLWNRMRVPRGQKTPKRRFFWGPGFPGQESA